MPGVNSEILLWARQTAGLSVDDAAHKLGFRGTRKRTASDRLEALEGGLENPSRAVLLKMSKIYRRPLLAFYLAVPPSKGDRGEDFRTLPDTIDPTTNALVDALVRNVRARQNMVRSILEDDEAEKLLFVGSKRIEDGIPSLVADIKKKTSFDLSEFRRCKNPEDAFSYLREITEQLGVFVLLIGNLGSHHTTLEPEVFRGFALADDLAPFVVVNDQDAKAAWSFTLLHELAHIWIGETGVSGGRIEGSIERFCNEVASELLFPTDDVRQFALVDLKGSFEEIVQKISAFARPINLSYTMVAFRLFREGLIDHAMWEKVRRHFRDLWKKQRANARAQAKENNTTGPNYYVVRRHRLGKALIELVGQQLSEGELSPVSAARILGVKARSVAPLVGGVDKWRIGVNQ